MRRNRKGVHLRADRSDESTVNDVTEPHETHADDVVVVAVSDRVRAWRLMEALSSCGFDAVAVTPIARVAGVVDGERPFVVIVDDADLEWLRDVSDLLDLRPTARILALVEIVAPPELLAAVSAGVSGFVSPAAGTDAIARTVRELSDKGVAIPRGLVPALVEEIRRGPGRSVRVASGAIEVTDREWEILLLLLQRRTTREISERLFVSVGTVRSHISALGKKLGAEDREDAIRLLRQRGS